MGNRNIFTTMSIVMLLMFIAMIVNITLNLREFGFSSAKTKAQLVAQSVKHGLTAHMVNGIMANRDFYVNQTKRMEGVDDLWIIRSQSIIKQYGESGDTIRDEIDKKVLETGESIEKVNENFLGHSTYRITIPYKAEKTKEIDCMSCHETKDGETLGVISMVLTVDDLKATSTKIIFITSVIAFFLMFGIVWYMKRIMNPYFTIFGLIKKVMRKANKGDYSGRIEGMNEGEAKEVAHWINEHMDKLQTSLIKIEEQINVFLTAHKSDVFIDPIMEVKQTVSRLADIYRFRKTIEKDEHLEDIYHRFASILEDKFGIEEFHFIEADTTNKKTQIVYVHSKIYCDPVSNGCRADRTNSLVDSCQFRNVCNKFTTDETKEYICIPYSISNDLDFILSMVCNSQEEQERVRVILPFIQDYIDSAKPEIVSKKLMQILEKSAQTDALTGLYNRKFLEKYIDNTLYKGAMKNVQCGIMMVDIDFFKLINDNYGHDIGDIAIKTIANTLIDVVEEKDVVIRFGGEEFIVVLLDCNEEKLNDIAEKIRIAFSQQQIQAKSETFSKTVSIGTSLFPNKDKSFWKYVKQSDIALYKAKQTGRNKVVRYDDSINLESSQGSH
jgi:two-component system, cell cycle response regulator